MIYLEARKSTIRSCLICRSDGYLIVWAKNLQLEQLVTLGRTLQSFAHELNTLLMTLNTLNQMWLITLEKSALDHEIQKDILESLSLAGSELSRCQRLTHSLLKSLINSRQPMTYWNMTDLLERAIQFSKSGTGYAAVSDWMPKNFNNIN